MAKTMVKLMAITQNFDPTTGNPTQYKVNYQVLDEVGAIVSSNALLIVRMDETLDLTGELSLTTTNVEGYTLADGTKVGETGVKEYGAVLTDYLRQAALRKEGIKQ